MKQNLCCLSSKIDRNFEKGYFIGDDKDHDDDADDDNDDVGDNDVDHGDCNNDDGNGADDDGADVPIMNQAQRFNA